MFSNAFDSKGTLFRAPLSERMPFVGSGWGLKQGAARIASRRSRLSAETIPKTLRTRSAKFAELLLEGKRACSK
jgi:hypothetical protein